MCGVSPKVIRKVYQHWIEEHDERMRKDQADEWLDMGLDSEGNPIPVRVN